VPTLPEKAEKEIMVSEALNLVKAATLNLGQRSRTSAGEGLANKAKPLPGCETSINGCSSRGSFTASLI
jgi:hypothetical protein